MAGGPSSLPQPFSAQRHVLVSTSPSLLPETSWLLTAGTLGHPRNPAPSGSLRARKSPSPPSSHISGSQGQQHMLLPSEGENYCMAPSPRAQLLKACVCHCSGEACGSSQILFRACQQASLMGQTLWGGRKKNKGGGWKWNCFEIHCCCC